METLNAGIAFIGGIISFFSPCIVVLVPAFLSNLAGTSLSQIQQERRAFHVPIFISSLAFVLGFTTVFTLLGTLTGTLSQDIPGFTLWLGRIGGIIIILMGLAFLGLIRIPLLHPVGIPATFKASSGASFLLGLSFAVGWTPCVGPILAAILVLAGTSASTTVGGGLLFLYSLGLMLPFLFVGVFTGAAYRFFQQMHKVFSVINIIGGLLLLVLGVAVFTNTLSGIVSYLYQLGR